MVTAIREKVNNNKKKIMKKTGLLRLMQLFAQSDKSEIEE